MENIFDRRLVNLLLIVLIILVGILAVNEFKQSRFIGSDIGPQATIMVSGQGEVFAKPDLAIVNVTVQNEAKEVKTAQVQNTQKSNQVIEFLKNQGIADKDIKTINYNIRPRYEFRSGGLMGFPEPGERRVLVGYEVTNTLEVKIRNLDKIGAVLDGAVQAGANQVSALRFTVENDEELKRQARQQAIQKAKDKARQLAADLGVSLVRIVSFNESGTGRPIIFAETAALGKGGGGPAPAPDIQPGENKIQVNVNITYEIR